MGSVHKLAVPTGFEKSSACFTSRNRRLVNMRSRRDKNDHFCSPVACFDKVDCQQTCTEELREFIDADDCRISWRHLVGSGRVRLRGARCGVPHPLYVAG